MSKPYLAAMLLLASAGGLAGAGPAYNRYAVILNEPAAAVRTEIEKRGVRVTGAVQRVLNAVFVVASKEQAAQLRGLAGVKGVAPVRRYLRKLDRAVQLTNVPAAWSQLGGVGNAGAGIKIGILDSGIDQRQAAFQDASLVAPAGYPKCSGADCAFTTNKVIAARSYVAVLAAGTPPDPAVDSTPDDVSMRDHSGHGTALAMVAAGVTNTGPADTITGVAPKAFLGSYKIFGSPGVHDYTDDAAIAQALEDALADGMDIAVLSLGSPAFSGPLDQGAICGLPAGTPCDVAAAAVENAIGAGMMVVVAAGNDGDVGDNLPTLSTIGSPATAPSAIAAGASTNSHTWVTSVQVQGKNVPSNLQFIVADAGDGPLDRVTAPLADTTALDGTGSACGPLTAGALKGKIALVACGSCSFDSKVLDAQNAGAVGVILLQTPGLGAAVPPGGLAGTEIPTVMIGDADGQALRSYLASNLGVAATVAPTSAMEVPVYNEVAEFSSHGPSIDMRLKPEMVAVGTEMYMATQSWDAYGDMYDPSGYTVGQGTSFAASMIAGALALAKQQNPGFTAWQLKSAVVSTATQDVTEKGASAPAVATGNGKLSAGEALQTAVTVKPAAISFGALGQGTAPAPQTLTIHYSGNSAATLTLAAVSVSGAAPSLDKTVLAVAPGQADQTVTLTLASGIPAAKMYEGGIVIQGAGATLRVPYIYAVGDGTPNDIPALWSVSDGTAGDSLGDNTAGNPALEIRAIDAEGVPVAGWPVTFSVTSGGGEIVNADSQTNAEGVARAGATLGPSLGTQLFSVEVGPLGHYYFDITARSQPTIAAITNAASQAPGPISAGSYITLWGSGLSDFTQGTNTAALPLAIDMASVSFDVPGAGISLPGRILYVSPTQVNLQVPWELAGQQSVEIKVTVGYSFGQVFTAAVAEYSPAVYLIPDAGTGPLVAAAEDLSGAVISTLNPAHASQQQTIQLYLNGLGPVSNPPAIGDVAQAQPLSSTLATPAVTIGGVGANVIWSGLTPTSSGLYQINLKLAANTPTGTQPLVVAIGGVSSAAVNIAVQ